MSAGKYQIAATALPAIGSEIDGLTTRRLGMLRALVLSKVEIANSAVARCFNKWLSIDIFGSEVQVLNTPASPAIAHSTPEQGLASLKFSPVKFSPIGVYGSRHKLYNSVNG